MEGGPPGFPRDFPCPAVLGHGRHRPTRRSPTGLSPALARHPRRFGSDQHARRASADAPRPAHNPRAATAAALARRGFGQRARFAHHYYGPRGCLLFLGVLRCFSSPGSLQPPIDSAAGDAASPASGCPIRRSADHRPSTAPRGFSQSPTSFVGPWRPGIPRALILARRSPTGSPEPAASFLSFHHSALVKERSWGPMVDSPCRTISSQPRIHNCCRAKKSARYPSGRPAIARPLDIYTTGVSRPSRSSA